MQIRSTYHIERDFEAHNLDFFYLKYHQIRFISFGIWFIGLFLTDFTSLVNSGTDDIADVIDLIKIISIIHIVFVLLFFIYILFRNLKFSTDEAHMSRLKLYVQSLFDLNLHIDVISLVFSFNFSKNANVFYVFEVGIIMDSLLIFYLTPFKKWRGFIDLFGLLPTTSLLHVRMFHKFKCLYAFLPLFFALIFPLIFTIYIIGCSNTLSPKKLYIIMFFDPTLLPNRMKVPKHQVSLDDDKSTEKYRSQEERPKIQDPATSPGENSENYYVDFKSLPFLVLSSFFLHYSLFYDGAHTITLLVMGHYFIALSSILINTRVVEFPSLILTNVDDPNVKFNSVWPELSFV